MKQIKKKSLIVYTLLLLAGSITFSLVAKADTYPGNKTYDYKTSTWSCDCPATANTCTCSY